MEAMLHDLRFGIRGLLKSPGFTAIAVITLALGIGANWAIFGLVRAILIRPLPFQDPDRLVWVWDVQPQPKRAPVSYPEFVDGRSTDEVFELMSAGRGVNFNVKGPSDPERLPGFRYQLSGVRRLGSGILEHLRLRSEARRL
jgi:putative ABC transport system permease protein